MQATSKHCCNQRIVFKVENNAFQGFARYLLFVETKTFENARIILGYQLYDELGGFYNLYQIERDNEDRDTSESDRGSFTGGLKSPYGQWGSILANYHWTWDYLKWGIPWNILQRMLIDAPKYAYKKKDSEKSVEVTQAEWEKKLSNIPTR